MFVATLSGTSGGSTDNQGIYLVDSSGVMTQVIRAGQIIGGETVGIPTFLDGPNYGGLSGLNDSGQLAVWSALNGNEAVFLWSKANVPADLRLLGAANAGQNVAVSFQAVGGTTNFLQAASSPLGPFVDIGSIAISGSGLVNTNYTELGAGTNQTRFYRIRQVH